MAEMKGSSAPLYLVASTPVVVIGPHESPSIQLTSVMTLSDFVSGGVIAQTYILSGEAALFDFESVAYLARQEQFEGVADIPSFEVDLDIRQAEARFIYPHIPAVRLLGAVPRPMVSITTATLVFGKPEMYQFETTAVFNAPAGFRSVSGLYDFETDSSILVPNGLAGRTELYGIETRGIILIPPLLFQATTELEPFATEAWVTFPFQFNGSPDLHDFESTGSIALGYVYSINVDLPDFEGPLKGGMEPALTGVATVSSFESAGLFLNQANASFLGVADIPEFSAVGEFALSYAVNAILNATLPFIQGSMDLGAERIWANLVSPSPLFVGDLFVNPNKINGALLAPIPFVEGTINAVIKVNGALNAPLPFIDGTIDNGNSRLVYGELTAPLPFIFGAIDVAPVEIGGTLFAPLPSIDGFLNAPIQVKATLLAPMPFISGEMNQVYRINAMMIAPQPFIRGRIKKDAGTSSVQNLRHFNISLGIRL